MIRQLQINTAGTWKTVADLRGGSLDEVKTAVVLLTTGIEGEPTFRIIKLLWGSTPYVICTWSRPRGWRQGS